MKQKKQEHWEITKSYAMNGGKCYIRPTRITFIPLFPQFQSRNIRNNQIVNSRTCNQRNPLCTNNKIIKIKPK